MLGVVAAFEVMRMCRFRCHVWHLLRDARVADFLEAVLEMTFGLSQCVPNVWMRSIMPRTFACFAPLGRHNSCTMCGVIFGCYLTNGCFKLCPALLHVLHPLGGTIRALCAESLMDATWLILPVVICLSQRLSHACVSMN